MCHIHNQPGSLTTVLNSFQAHGLPDTPSLDEMLSLPKNSLFKRQEIIAKHEALIKQEAVNLRAEIDQQAALIAEMKSDETLKYQERIEALSERRRSLSYKSKGGVANKLVRNLKSGMLSARIVITRTVFKFRMARIVRKPLKLKRWKSVRHHFILTNFSEAVRESSAREISEMELRNQIIDFNKNAIYGAIGEQKVIEELSNLPDDFHLINDFTLKLDPALYHSQTSTWIQSLQIDHLLVSRAGIFIIETKNWSRQSVNESDFYSPVAQINRANYALYKLLRLPPFTRFGIDPKNWGRKSIPVKNILVFTGFKPVATYHYVKILSLSQLCSYVKYFPPVFSGIEVEAIIKSLLDYNGGMVRLSGGYRRAPRYVLREFRLPKYFKLFR